MKVFTDISKSNAILALLIIFFFPFVILVNYAFDIRTGLISYAYRGFVLLICLYIFSVSIFSQVKLKYIIFPLIIFWIFYIFRLIIDLEFKHIFIGDTYDKKYFYLYSIFVNFIPMLALSVIKPINLNYLALRLRQLLIIFVLILLSIIVYHYLNKQTILVGGRFWLARPKFEFLNPVTIAIYCSLLIILNFFKKRKNIFDWSMILICFYIIGITASRGPLLSLMLVLFVAILIKPSIIFNSFEEFFIKSLIVLMVFFAIIAKSLYIVQRINSIDDQSNTIRYGIFGEAFKQFFDSPFIGSHFLVMPSASNSHNLFVDILISLGIIGFVIFLPVLYRFIKNIALNKCNHVIFVVAFFFFLTTLTSGAIYNYNEFWYLLSLVITNPINTVSKPANN